MRLLLATALALLLAGPIRFGSSNRAIETFLEDPLQIDLSIWLQVAVLGFGGIIALLAWLQRGLDAPPLPAPLRSGPFFVYLLYAIIAALSVLYSVQPLYTLYFAARLLTAIVLVGLTAERLSWQTTLEIFYVVHLLRWLSIVTLYYLLPDSVGTDIRAVGYRLHAQAFNDYGISAAVSGLYFLLKLSQEPRRGRILLLVYYLFTLYFVYLSRTRSTLLIAALFLCCTVGIAPRFVSRTIGVMALFFIVVSATSPASEALWAYFARGQKITELLSLSGRTIAFEYLLQIWSQSPWLGFGFAGGSRASLVAFRYEYDLGIGAAHDGLSRVLVDLGALGTAVLLTSVAWTGLRLWRCIPLFRPSGIPLLVRAQSIALFGAACVRSVVSEGIADLSSIYLMALLLAWVISGAAAMSTIVVTRAHGPYRRRLP